MKTSSNKTFKRITVNPIYISTGHFELLSCTLHSTDRWQTRSISYVTWKTIETGPENFHAGDGVSDDLLLARETLQILSYIFIFSGFEDVLLSGFRVLSEQQPIAEDYSSFK